MCVIFFKIWKSNAVSGSVFGEIEIASVHVIYDVYV